MTLFSKRRRKHHGYFATIFLTFVISGKDFMLEAIDVLKGVGPRILICQYILRTLPGPWL
jgi:hypothetical protein